MRRYRIGLTVGTMDSDYPHAVRMGIQNTLEEAGHVLVAVSDLVPHHVVANGIDYYRMAFQIAARMNLDAIIVPVGCVAAHLRGANDQALELLQLMDPKNTIVIEREVEGYRCINKDGAPGMRACMRHLIERCHFTRIAFISGPESSRGAREREDIYFEEMAAHGLATPPSLFCRGNFAGACADVIERLLDDNPDLEAVACACDLIAYTVYDVCHRRGIAVGQDLAVTGFDDHPRSVHLDPPLTTVHMTGYDLGCVAAREAIRLCQGLPQRQRLLYSTFCVRNSCGEDVRAGINLFRDLLSQRPLPSGHIVRSMVDATLHMAGPSVTRDFHRRMTSFFERVRESYLAYLACPSEDVRLFSSQDLASLFDTEYAGYLSLEGFHAVATGLLEALRTSTDEVSADWVFDQESYLHLRIARLLESEHQHAARAMSKREWTTFQLVGDSLREDREPRRAYRLMLSELGRLGVAEADLFLLSEPTTFANTTSFALSDTLTYIGSLSGGEVTLGDEAAVLRLQEVLDLVLTRQDPHVLTVGALVAGTEMVGLCVMDAGKLDESCQMMVFLNLGFSLRHLQVVAEGREMIALLNEHSLLLERESQHDELTGLLNRRGFSNRIDHLLTQHLGRRAEIVYLDLDGLKTINDTYGHEVGDEAIVATARILEACVPSTGLLARLGGDEFVAFVLCEEGMDSGVVTAEVERRMRAINDEGTHLFALSISHGAASFAIGEGTASCVDELMARADERLYEMKRTRRRSRRFEGT